MTIIRSELVYVINYLFMKVYGKLIIVWDLLDARKTTSIEKQNKLYDIIMICKYFCQTFCNRNFL